MSSAAHGLLTFGAQFAEVAVDALGVARAWRPAAHRGVFFALGLGTGSTAIALLILGSIATFSRAGLGRHGHLPVPAAKPRTLRHSQPPASSWTRQPAAFPAGKCSEAADTGHDVPDAHSDRARLPGAGPAPRLGASEDVPDEGLTREAGPGSRRYGMAYQETGSGDERDM